MLEQLRIECRNRRAVPELVFPEIAMVNAAQLAAGFFQNQAAGCVVPQALAAMQDQIETPRCQPAPVKRGRADIALAAVRRNRHQSAGQFAWQVFQLDAGNRAMDGGRKRFQRQALAVEEGAVAFQRVIHFVHCRVVDHPQLRAAISHECNRDGKMRHAVNEIGGAINRIDTPHAFVTLIPEMLLLVGTHFLAQHRHIQHLP